MAIGIAVNDLPEEVQQALYEELRAKFGKKKLNTVFALNGDCARL